MYCGTASKDRFRQGVDLRLPNSRRPDIRLVAGPTEHVNRREVFDRDEWRCQVCKEPVDQTLRWPDPLSATLDHVVPLSRGGRHAPDNVQLAHFICNVRKGARAA